MTLLSDFKYIDSNKARTSSANLLPIITRLLFLSSLKLCSSFLVWTFNIAEWSLKSIAPDLWEWKSSDNVPPKPCKCAALPSAVCAKPVHDDSLIILYIWISCIQSIAAYHVHCKGMDENSGQSWEKSVNLSKKITEYYYTSLGGYYGQLHHILRLIESNLNFHQ